MVALTVEAVEQPRGLRLTGELDLARVNEVDAALKPLVAEGGEITMDVEELRFMDSSAIQLLIRALQGLEGRGRIVLRRPGTGVKRLIDVMGLDRIENLEISE
jgi:anti-anti-sigma factor